MATTTKTAKKKTASKKTASKKTASKKTASKKTASKKTASKKTASKKTASKETIVEAPTLRFKPVTASTWPLFEQLFERPGAPSYCWCMAWRADKDEVKLDKAGRKRAMHDRVKRRTFIGLVGIDDDGEPQAWVSVGPRDTFRAAFADVRDGDDDETIWAVNCFFVPRALRRQGLIAQMIEAAKAIAKKRGATILEATPVAPSSPSYRYGGFISSFDGADFVKIGKAGSRRDVMRFVL